MSDPLTTLRCFILLAVLGLPRLRAERPPPEHHPGRGCGAQRVGLSPRIGVLPAVRGAPPCGAAALGLRCRRRVGGTVPGPPRGGGSGQRRGSAGPRLLQPQWDDEKRGAPSHPIPIFSPMSPPSIAAGGHGWGARGAGKPPDVGPARGGGSGGCGSALSLRALRFN